MKAFAQIKKWLWPSPENQFKPALIQVRGLLAILVLTVAANLLINYWTFGQPRVLSYATDVTLQGLLLETNNQRQTNGFDAYTLDAQLTTAAQAKADHMISNNYWSHIAPDGTTPWQFIDDTGYIYLKAGENLAYGFLTSGGVVQGWMDSPGHKANILDEDFKEVGFGILDGSDFQSDENTVVVAMYALPYQGQTNSTQDEIVAATSTENSTPSGTDLSAESTAQQPAEQPLQEQPPVEEVERDIPQPLQVIRGPDLTKPDSSLAAEASTTTNLEAVLEGQAPLTLYITLFLLMSIGMVYFLRHVRLVHNFFKAGEHLVQGHPLLEASLIYLLIWILLTASFGTVL